MISFDFQLMEVKKSMYLLCLLPLFSSFLIFIFYVASAFGISIPLSPCNSTFF